MSKELFPGGDNHDNEAFIHGLNPAEQPSIDFHEAKEKPAEHFEYKGQTGKDAFTLLEQHATEIEFQQFDFGKMITGINGRISEENKEFWQLDVDGEMSQLGAEACETEDDQIISWTIMKIDPNWSDETQ